jgi:hypothetical protein
MWRPKVKINWQGLLDRIKTFSPRKTGALAESWIIVDSSNTKAIFQSDKPYAEIQDKGGFVPPVEGKLMVWESGGETIFSMRRKGFSLPGSNYTQRAFDDWFTGLGRDSA